MREALADFDDADVIDTAQLLVSELVTNAVLHAGTDIEVTVSVSGGVVRVDVVDQSRRLPTRKNYDRSAMTGRGLGLVDASARQWGVRGHPSGKSVWFELAAHDATPTDAPAIDAPALSRPHTVTLHHLPVRLLWATVQYGDALIRDLALLALTEDEPALDPTRWQSPELDLGPILVQVEAALAAGEDFIDIDVALPVDANHDALLRLALIDEADRLAHEDALLVVPGLPEVAACRHWLLGEIVRQIEGQAPTPWVLPEEEGMSAAVAELTPEERSRFASTGVATVVADESNHILFVNDEAAELLGWEASDLEGHRLTRIVPPELREAHLAGYTRYLLTGEASVLNTPVRVPALRRDGSQIDVTLEIRVIRSRPQVFAATLRKV